MTRHPKFCLIEITNQSMILFEKNSQFLFRRLVISLSVSTVGISTKQTKVGEPHNMSLS